MGDTNPIEGIQLVRIKDLKIKELGIQFIEKFVGFSNYFIALKSNALSNIQSCLNIQKVITVFGGS